MYRKIILVFIYYDFNNHKDELLSTGNTKGISPSPQKYTGLKTKDPAKNQKDNLVESLATSLRQKIEENAKL